jgi:cytochrome c biogenesis protein CcdA/thiol-disulfide isomerase/thioredoxin
MILLIIFALAAGIVTILSPCILPILPIILSGSFTGDKKRPLGIIVGFILSFTFFTLFLTFIIKLTGLPPDILRTIAVFVIIFFGLSLIVPQAQKVMEQLVSRLSSFTPQSKNKSGFIGGIIIGLSLGLVWAPCVGPILASVITLAATSQINIATFFITLAYSIGSAIPMIALMYGGRSLLNRLPFLTKNSIQIQKIFGLFMIATAVMIFFNIDRSFQTYILTRFPSYGTGLTKFEDNSLIKSKLDDLKNVSVKDSLQSLTNSPAPNPTFEGYTKWLNLPDGKQSLTLNDLKGKVVLVDFWTYTCINCVRTLPHVTSWYEKYKDQGFVVIGVHTPEFEFEKVTSNVVAAMKDFKIRYPVVQDNDYNIWNSYNNQYWPAEYLIDSKGNLVDSHFGEGNYDETERKIQNLLKEAGKNVNTNTVSIKDTTPISRLTPETYLGLSRLERITNSNVVAGQQNYEISSTIPDDEFSYGGTWNIQPEEAIAQENASISLHFNADNVYLVITPKSSLDEIQVFLDGKIISSAQAGKDVINGTVRLDMARLYNVVDLHGESGNHILKLEFKTSGTSVFAFTFG